MAIWLPQRTLSTLPAIVLQPGGHVIRMEKRVHAVSSYYLPEKKRSVNL